MKINHGVCYTCDHCGGTFIEGTTEELANAEAEREWGVKNASTSPFMARVCDDCYQKMMTWYKEVTAE